VGAVLPRSSWLPLSWPLWIDLFFEYVEPRIHYIWLISTLLNSRYFKLISLSLYFFNLLPLPFLDGSQLISALLDLFLSLQHSQPDTFYPEVLEAAQPPFNNFAMAMPAHSRRGSGAQTSNTRSMQWKMRVENIVTTVTLTLIGLGVALGGLVSLRS
jgi:membrane-associated protease RseP (regulator of RpoE activity)